MGEELESPWDSTSCFVGRCLLVKELNVRTTSLLTLESITLGTRRLPLSSQATSNS